MADADPLPVQIDLHIDATLGDIRAALNMITLDMRSRHMPGALIDDVNIVLCEVMTNIARHGYPFKTGWIRCMLTLHSDSVECHVTDAGVAYDPGVLGMAPPPQILAEGGYGWALIRALSVGLRYERRGTENALHFVVPVRPPSCTQNPC